MVPWHVHMRARHPPRPFACLRRDKIIQACTQPTTDQCVEEVQNLIFDECGSVDSKASYCPDACKAALANTTINKDSRCREVVANTVGQLGEDL